MTPTGLMEALIDNSSFAGVMRCLAPELPMHQDFWEKYPEHREVDHISLAEFLTAICLFDFVVLDSSSYSFQASLEGGSGVISKDLEIELEGYEIDDPWVEETLARCENPQSWVEELLDYLPSEVRLPVVISRTGPYTKSLMLRESCDIAYEVFCSAFQENLLWLDKWKLPNVYTDPSYILRPKFERINEKNGNLLNEKMLAQAMFLHRGLYLLSRAKERGRVYMPYLYRGKMLSAISPLLSLPRPDDKSARLRLPLLKGSRPGENNYLCLINKIYYELLEKVCWYSYEEGIPFIGAAILAKAKGEPKKAVEIALDYREKGRLRTQWRELSELVQRGERGKYEMFLKGIKMQLEDAAISMGASIPNRYLQTFFRLAISWLPPMIPEAIASAVEILPHNAQYWANKFMTFLIKPSPFQMLFLDHVKTIRSA